MEDLYDILGVARDASADAIKTAYRALARKLHPDVNKAPDAQEQFAKVQQAYEVLSDDAKRKRYDRTGRADGDPFAGTPYGGTGFQGFDADGIGDMFDAFFKGRGQQQAGPFGGAQTRQRAQPPRDLNTRAPLSLELETIAKGGKIKARTPGGETVEVTIPPAVAAGAVLRIKEKGERDARTNRVGDLLLEIRAKPHPTVTRGTPTKPDPTGLDLTITADLSIATATLGGKVTVDRLGESLTLTIPAATPSGRALRLRGKGLTNAAGKAGDLYVETRIVPPHPSALTEQQIETLREIGNAQRAHNAEQSEQPQD